MLPTAWPKLFGYLLMFFIIICSSQANHLEPLYCIGLPINIYYTGIYIVYLNFFNLKFKMSMIPRLVVLSVIAIKHALVLYFFITTVCTYFSNLKHNYIKHIIGKGTYYLLIWS